MEAHHKHTPASLQLLTLVEGALFGYRWLFLFWHMPSLGYIFAYLQAFAFEAFMRWIIWKEMSRFANDGQASTVYKIVEYAVIVGQLVITITMINFLGLAYTAQELQLGDLVRRTVDSIPIPFVVSVCIFQTVSSIEIWLALIAVYYFRQAALKPHEETHYVYQIFGFKNMLLPWLVLIFVVTTQKPKLALAVLIIGVVQQLWRQEMLLKLPFFFYKALEFCIPEYIRSIEGYVRVEEVSHILKQKCLRFGSSGSEEEVQQQAARVARYSEPSQQQQESISEESMMKRTEDYDTREHISKVFEAPGRNMNESQISVTEEEPKSEPILNYREVWLKKYSQEQQEQKHLKKE